MIRFVLALIAVIAACAPVEVRIPANAPTLKNEPTKRLNARVAISYSRLSDKNVVEKYHVRNVYKPNETRKTVAVYHVAAASRAALTRAFRRIFAEVAVIDGAIPGDRYDFVLMPELDFFTLRDEFISETSVDLTYNIFIFGGNGPLIGRERYSGEATSEAELPDNLSRVEGTIVRAIEDAGETVVQKLPELALMKPWRSP